MIEERNRLEREFRETLVPEAAKFSRRNHNTSPGAIFQPKRGAKFWRDKILSSSRSGLKTSHNLVLQ